MMFLRLEFLMDVGEHLPQVGQHRAGELVHQERAVGLEDVVRGSEDSFPDHRDPWSSTEYREIT